MSGIKVFLVEDKFDVAASLTALLEMSGSIEVVHHVTTESEAVAWLDAGGVSDVIIVDLFLASGTGMGVLKELQHRATAPIRIVLTNRADPAVQARCKLLGAEAVFDKASEVEDLIRWFARTPVAPAPTPVD